jgi:hypothetical protein
MTWASVVAGPGFEPATLSYETFQRFGTAAQSRTVEDILEASSCENAHRIPSGNRTLATSLAASSDPGHDIVDDTIDG